VQRFPVFVGSKWWFSTIICVATLDTENLCIYSDLKWACLHTRISAEKQPYEHNIPWEILTVGAQI